MFLMLIELVKGSVFFGFFVVVSKGWIPVVWVWLIDVIVFGCSGSLICTRVVSWLLMVRWSHCFFDLFFGGCIFLFLRRLGFFIIIF